MISFAQKLPVRNSWELMNKKLPIPLPILYDFELIREALANTLYIEKLSGSYLALREHFKMISSKFDPTILGELIA